MPSNCLPAMFGDPPTPRARDFRHQVTHVQPFEQPPYRRTGPTFLSNLLEDPEQWRADVAVAEATRNVVAIQHCLERLSVLVTSHLSIYRHL